MNTSVTSRDTILSVSRQFITQNGFGSVNMRAIAAACGVSVGSVYNYFPSKGDLICAVVESVWHDIFHLSGQSSQFSSFPDCVKWLFDSIRQGCEEYPAFFTLHSLSGGILLRRIPAVPTQFIAVFYSGLGAALLLAGILFGVKFFTSSSHSSAA